MLRKIIDDLDVIEEGFSSRIRNIRQRIERAAQEEEMSRIERPLQGTAYTLTEIHTRFQAWLDELSEYPSLGTTTNAIQTAHVTQEQMLSVPGMGESMWVYVQTTHEGIPVFRYVGTAADFESLFDQAPLLDWMTGLEEGPGKLWITPKGFPREQYISRS